MIVEQGKKEAVTGRGAVCPETFLPQRRRLGAGSSPGTLHACPGKPPVFVRRWCQVNSASHGSPKVRLRKAWLQCPSSSFACNLVRVVCQALGLTLDLCDFRSHHICQADGVIPILHVSSLSYRHSVFAQSHSVRHRTKNQAWGFLSFHLIQALW